MQFSATHTGLTGLLEKALALLNIDETRSDVADLGRAAQMFGDRLTVLEIKTRGGELHGPYTKPDDEKPPAWVWTAGGILMLVFGFASSMWFKERENVRRRLNWIQDKLDPEPVSEGGPRIAAVEPTPGFDLNLFIARLAPLIPLIEKLYAAYEARHGAKRNACAPDFDEMLRKVREAAERIAAQPAQPPQPPAPPPTAEQPPAP